MARYKQDFDDQVSAQYSLPERAIDDIALTFTRSALDLFKVCAVGTAWSTSRASNVLVVRAKYQRIAFATLKDRKHQCEVEASLFSNDVLVSFLRRQFKAPNSHS